MNVLLAVDQSRNSSAATKFVEAFRLPDSSKLYLLFVEEPQGEVPGQDHFPRKFRHLREELSKMRQKNMEKARQLVNRRAAPFRAKGLEVHPIVVEGIPGTEILTAIEQHQIDLVALGTKGLSGIKRFLLGSVSEWMLNEAPCSVLIVRGKTRPKKSTEGMKILIATDGSPDAQEASGSSGSSGSIGPGGPGGRAQRRTRRSGISGPAQTGAGPDARGPGSGRARQPNLRLPGPPDLPPQLLFDLEGRLRCAGGPGLVQDPRLRQGHRLGNRREHRLAVPDRGARRRSDLRSVRLRRFPGNHLRELTRAEPRNIRGIWPINLFFNVFSRPFWHNQPTGTKE